MNLRSLRSADHLIFEDELSYYMCSCLHKSLHQQLGEGLMHWRVMTVAHVGMPHLSIRVKFPVNAKHLHSICTNWNNIEDVGPTLYKCYTNVLCFAKIYWAQCECKNKRLDHIPQGRFFRTWYLPIRSHIGNNSSEPSGRCNFFLNK